MDTLDNFRERLEALEQQTKTVAAHTRTLKRRLRWWRGIACGVVMLALLSLALPSGKAADAPGRGMAERMATVERTLSAMAFDAAANEVVISGANLRIVNGLGNTETTNGLGNLIVGYNELRAPIGAGTDTRTGSHNIVGGKFNNFSSFGGLVLGEFSEISGAFASVSGGIGNKATGDNSSVSGGVANTASGERSSVSGGGDNTASAHGASVSGGNVNTASNLFASVSGGELNTASGRIASVSGGRENSASGSDSSSVSGGFQRTAPAQFNWAAGALFSDQ
jgi:hypothetical protein